MDGNFNKTVKYLQSSNLNIYVDGDVIGNYLLVTVDTHEGSIAGENAINNNITVLWEWHENA